MHAQNSRNNSRWRQSPETCSACYKKKNQFTVCRKRKQSKTIKKKNIKVNIYVSTNVNKNQCTSIDVLSCGEAGKKSKKSCIWRNFFFFFLPSVWRLRQSIIGWLGHLLLWHLQVFSTVSSLVLLYFSSVNLVKQLPQKKQCLKTLLCFLEVEKKDCGSFHG